MKHEVTPDDYRDASTDTDRPHSDDNQTQLVHRDELFPAQLAIGLNIRSTPIRRRWHQPDIYPLSTQYVNSAP